MKTENTDATPKNVQRFLYRKDIEDRLEIKTTTFYKLIKQPDFPKAVRIPLPTSRPRWSMEKYKEWEKLKGIS